MLKLPIDNGNIDLSEYAKKSDVDAIGTSLGNKAEKKEVEKINSQLDTLTKKVDDEIKEIQSTTDTFKENINTSFNEFSNEQQNNFETLREEVLSDIEASYVGYDNEQHHDLESRLNSDFDKINQRVNDSSYLEYEGTSIKADNTYYGLTKEATVKGRTLQNLVPAKIYNDKSCYGSLSSDAKLNGTTLSCVAGGEYRNLFVNLKEFNLIKQNTDYTIILTIHKNTLEGEGNLFTFSNKEQTAQAFNTTITTKNNGLSVGTYKFVGRLKNDISACTYFFRTSVNSGATSGEIEFSYYILEGDYTNTPIEELPFVEGIQSVGENEVREDGKYLISGKSCGKNLVTEFRKINTNNLKIDLARPIKNGESFQFSFVPEGLTFTHFSVYCENSKTGVSDYHALDINRLSGILTARNDYDYIKIYCTHNPEPENLKDLMVAITPTLLPYEPYQESTYSYILDEPLRQLPNGVADSINLETGVLTRRVGKLILDGTNRTFTSYNEQCFENTNYYSHPIGQVANSQSCINNLLPSQVAWNNDNVETCIVNSTRTHIHIRILKSKLNAYNGSINKYLQANTITLYFELEKPKEMQLDQIQLKSFEGTTHIISNNTLQAHTSIKIPSNVQAVVTNLINENEALRSNVDILNVENEGLKETNEVQDELIDINMMATDEVYTMIEPLLASQPMSMERGASKLVDMYVAMVQRGLKTTIDQVPIRYRAEVQAILEALEK